VACVPGNFLIIDMSGDTPVLTQTDDVLPAIVADRLDALAAQLTVLQQNQEKIMTDMAAGQAQIQTLADGMNAVSDHVTSARDMLAAFIANNQTAALDFTPAMNALASMQTAAGTLDTLVPQTPSDPIQPVPAPPDPAPDPTTPITDPSTPDLPPVDVLPPDTPPIDPTVASDPTTSPNGGTVGGDPTPVQ
jgi:hypothetical protein